LSSFDCFPIFVTAAPRQPSQGFVRQFFDARRTHQIHVVRFVPAPFLSSAVSRAIASAIVAPPAVAPERPRRLYDGEADFQSD
jgi:hypothetical protein